MELREPISATRKARLSEVLETPSLTGATEQNLGWMNLSEENGIGLYAQNSCLRYSRREPSKASIASLPDYARD